jgi:AraC-like DNA-binding protein
MKWQFLSLQQLTTLMILHIIQTLLLAVITVSAASFFHGLRMEPSQLKRFFIRISSLLLIDAAFTLITDFVLKSDNYLDATVPFILLYGPVLYLSVTENTSKKQQKRYISLHFLVPLAVWLWFLLVVISMDRAQFMLLSQAKNALGIVSIFFYAFITIVKRNKIKSQFLSFRHYLLFSAMLLLVASMPLLLHLLSYPEAERQSLAILVIRIQIYFVMLLASVFTLYIQLSGHRNTETATTKNTAKSKISYKHSSLERDQMEMIFERLAAQMLMHHWFLKKDLSLGSLAKKLKIPPHHLSEVLNTVAGKNYHDYIAGLRINYAVELMKASPQRSLEEIMNASGYNSNSTFNRQFKKITEKSPGEFMKTTGV